MLEFVPLLKIIQILLDSVIGEIHTCLNNLIRLLIKRPNNVGLKLHRHEGSRRQYAPFSLIVS